MTQLEAILDWLSALPPAMLLAIMALLAAVENVFPPIPADVLVAFGGFLAARANGSPWPTFFAIWIGSVAGALLMYGLGRRLGSQWIRQRFHLHEGSDGERKLIAWHVKYGAAALFASRFLPGVRSIVPPLAGALRIPLLGLLVAISAASGIWYGFLTYLAFTAGRNWEALSQRVGALGLWTQLVVVVVVAVGAAIWRLRRRRAST